MEGTQMTVANIQRDENDFFFRDNGHGKIVFNPPTELDQGLNELTRHKIICFFREKGSAWLGNINQSDAEVLKEPILYQYSGEMVNTFAADFIIPGFDAELVQNVKLWSKTGKLEALNAIQDRINKIGGTLLYWV